MYDNRYVILRNIAQDISKDYNINLFFHGTFKDYYMFSMVTEEDRFIYKILADLPLFAIHMILLENIRKDIINAKQ